MKKGLLMLLIAGSIFLTGVDSDSREPSARAF